MVGIDHVQQLVDFSEANIRKSHSSLIDSGSIKLVGMYFSAQCTGNRADLISSFSVGDGRQGYSSEGPYDAIHVGAAAPTLPQAVLDSSHYQNVSYIDPNLMIF